MPTPGEPLHNHLAKRLNWNWLNVLDLKRSSCIFLKRKNGQNKLVFKYFSREGQQSSDRIGCIEWYGFGYHNVNLKSFLNPSHLFRTEIDWNHFNKALFVSIVFAHSSFGLRRQAITEETARNTYTKREAFTRPPNSAPPLSHSRLLGVGLQQTYVAVPVIWQVGGGQTRKVTDWLEEWLETKADLK